LVTKKKSSEKTGNVKPIVVIVICVIISLSMLYVVFNMNSQSSEILDKTPVGNKMTTMDDYIENLAITHPIKAQSTPYLDLYLTNNDINRINQQLPFIDGIRLDLNPLNAEQFIEDLKPNPGTVVIYPVFTSAAYKEPGFYTYFGGRCDESCVTDVSFENPEFQYTSSGATAQILYHVGYDFLTDVDVDKNPKILQKYDTVILLHNEYVTKSQFDAFINHPNLIFLHPNALYAEVEVDYEKNTITLIQGHDYPPESPMKNGFNYEIEQEFHDYEYDNECKNWEFIEIENGFHLNCYPETIIIENFEILKKMKEL